MNRRTAHTTRKSPARTGGEDRPAWEASALCAQTDPDTFFPDKSRHDITKEAKRICNGDPKRGILPCPVKAECLADALEKNEGFGVRGGLTEHERRRLKRGAA